MCLAVPVLIKSVENNEADIDIGGISRRISVLLTPEVRPGDYVLVHAGYAINVLSPSEAEETLKLFEEMAKLAGEEER